MKSSWFFQQSSQQLLYSPLADSLDGIPVAKEYNKSSLQAWTIPHDDCINPSICLSCATPSIHLSSTLSNHFRLPETFSASPPLPFLSSYSFCCQCSLTHFQLPSFRFPIKIQSFSNSHMTLPMTLPLFWKFTCCHFSHFKNI